MRVLVTGHKGFLGACVKRALEDAGHMVSGYDLPEHDILHPPAGLLQPFAVVCHVAAVGDVYLAHRDPELAVRVNVLGTQLLLQAALEAGIRRFIYASTWEVVTNLDHPYNITKYAGDLLTQCYSSLYGLDTVVLRLGTLYGPNMRDTAVIPKFIKLAAAGRTITIEGTGEQYRQFLHVRDAAKAFVLAVDRGANGGVYNIVGGERITVRQIAELTGGKIEYVPSRSGDAQAIALDSTLAREELGWSPEIPFAAGFRELCGALEQTPTDVAPRSAVSGSPAGPAEGAKEVS